MRHVYKGLALETPSPATRPSGPALATLLLSAAANAALAVYQWVELVHVRGGGAAACAINEAVNCATVWNLPFASRMHELFGMPVAGLGLVWALTATMLAGLLAWRNGSGKEVVTAMCSVKLAALAGAASSIVFAAVSFASGVACPTCLVTYALVAIYAFAAFVMLPKPYLSIERLVPGAAWAIVVMMPIFLALLVPGQRTPKAEAGKLSTVASASKSTAGGAGAPSEGELAQYLESMPEPEKQFTAYALQKYLAGTIPLSVGVRVPRAFLGSPDAPVKVIDFTDILCSHCRQLELTLAELRRVLPEGRLSVEARHFPLDGECNPKAGKVMGDGIRCLAAKVQVCLEGTEAMWRVKHTLFENQNALSKDVILDAATKESGKTRDELLSCVSLPATQKKIDDDVEYALAYGITGTPLVLVNGRDTPPSGAFLLAMAVNRGDVNAPFFKSLPPPAPPQPHE